MNLPISHKIIDAYLPSKLGWLVEQLMMNICKIFDWVKVFLQVVLNLGWLIVCSFSYGLSSAPRQTSRSRHKTFIDWKGPANTGLIKVFAVPVLGHFDQYRSCVGIGTLTRCRCRGKTAERNTVFFYYSFWRTTQIFLYDGLGC